MTQDPGRFVIDARYVSARPSGIGNYVAALIARLPIFSAVGEFPSEQPNDIPLSPTAQAFYRNGTMFWQRYLTFWLSSLLNRVMFFVIPILITLVPILSIAPRVYRWVWMRPINRLHRHLGDIERDAEREGKSSKKTVGLARKQLEVIEEEMRALHVPRRFEPDLHRLRIHLKMVQELESRVHAIEGMHS